jgi:hypothetical protein
LEKSWFFLMMMVVVVVVMVIVESINEIEVLLR